jgi:hypothetical protein
MAVEFPISKSSPVAGTKYDLGEVSTSSEALRVAAQRWLKEKNSRL